MMNKRLFNYYFKSAFFRIQSWKDFSIYRDKTVKSMASKLNLIINLNKKQYAFQAI